MDLFEAEPGDPERVQIDAPAEKWPGLLAELVDVLRDTFQRRGRSEDDAIVDAQMAALAIGQYMGGRQIYMPHGDRLREWLRDRRIFLEYKGVNKGELAQRYDVTERRIEQIYAEQRGIYVRKIQRDMFQSRE